MLKSDADAVSSFRIMGQVPFRTWLILAIGALVHIPFVLPQLRWLWNSEHYSFFPMVLAAFGWLTWERLRDANVGIASALNIKAVGLLAINLGILALASLSSSMWLGWVSFLFFLWAAAHLLLAPANAAKVRGPFLVLLLIIPLPLGLDTSLVIQLQKLATSQGSLLLDYFGIRHSVTGVAVRLPDTIFLIEDACSGINSLFSALATILAYCVYCRFAMVRTLANMAQTVVWVLVANSVRVFLIVYSSVRWNLGLGSGWRHEVLGYSFFALIMVMSLSTDQLIRHFFPPRTAEYGFSPRRKQRPRWMRLVTTWLEAPFGARTASILAGCFVLSFVLTGVITAAQAWSTSRQVATANFAQQLALELGETDLPEHVEGWRRMGFEKVTRDQGDVFGINSLIWTYEQNGVQAKFSIDGAYPDFHDLWYCYSSTGWGLRYSDNIMLSGSLGGAETEAVATELQLYRGDSEQAYILYTCMDATGHVVPPPAPAETFARKLLNRLRAGHLLGGQGDYQVVPPVIQFQGFAYSNAEFFSHEQSGIQLLFAKLRETVAKKISGAPSEAVEEKYLLQAPFPEPATGPEK